MPLSTAHVAGDPIRAADVNAIATQVNANTSALAGHETRIAALEAGGGSGGSIVTWTKLITVNPMTALTGFTSRSGTWAAGGTYGVNQTANDQDDFLECNTDLSGYEYRAIEATVRVTNTGKVGFGFSDSGSWSTGDVAIALDEGNNTVWWDRFGTGGGTVGLTVNQNTDYTMKIVERAAGATWWVYVGGTKVATVALTSGNLGRVGLYCRNGAGWFRDVTVWGGVAAFAVPT